MHLCLDELRLLVAAIVFATPWLGWLRAWWHHRRRHVDCLGGESQTWIMNWDSPKWLSQETQALLDGFLPDDYDPACKLPKPCLADEMLDKERAATGTRR